MKLEFILVTLLQDVSSSQLFCPNGVELGSSARLSWSETQTNISSISWTSPDSLLAGSCIPLGCNSENGYTVERNTTHSDLHILKVGVKDIGVWTCTTSSSNSECTVEGYKIPMCNITSNNRTDELSLHERLFLTVDIRDYYCSTAFNFSVQTGAVTKLLPTSVPDVSDHITPTSLNVTEAHLGGVRLIFRCHTEQWNLTCDGVTQLNKSNDAGASNNVDIGTEQTTIIVAVSSTLVLIMVVVFVFVVVFLIYRKRVDTTDPASQNQPSDPRPVDEEETGSGLYATVMGRSPGPVRKNVIKVVVSQVPCDTAPKANTIHRGTASQGKHMQRDMAPKANTIPRGMASNEKYMPRDKAP